MKKYVNRMFMFVLVLLLVAGCSSNSGGGSPSGNTDSSQGSAGTGSQTPAANAGGSGEKVTLKLGHVWPESEIHAQAVLKFADEVEQKSGGSLVIEVFGNSTLGSDGELLEGLKVGTADIWIGGAGTLNSSSATAKIFTVPFMFDDQAHFDKVYSGEVGQTISDKIAAESGYKVLSYWTRGARWLTVNKEVNTPEDLAGLKIRVPDNPVFIKSFQRLGAAPTPMAFGEVFTSLQQGVIDGQENPLSLIHSSKFNEVVKYLVKTEHVREPISMVISESKFNSLSAEHQQILLEAANGAGKQYAADEVIAGDSQFVQLLQDGGMTLVEPDIAKFQEKLAGFVEEEFPELKEVYDLVRAAK